MVQYFNSRQLSEKLGINLARWKRWSREFLAPDPLGGKQSGYARQFSLNEAFLVFTGGYLVGNLGLSIPEAKTILSCFSEWVVDQDLFSGQGPAPALPGKETALFSKGASLVIQGGLNQNPRFFIEESESADDPWFHLDLSRGDGSFLNSASQLEKSSTRTEGDPPNPVGASGATSVKILFIHSMLREFKGALNL